MELRVLCFTETSRAATVIPSGAQRLLKVFQGRPSGANKSCEFIRMAGRASLSFLGQEDISLSGDPQVTYFIEKYQGQTPFAYRVDKVIFDEAGVVFGSENHRIIPR